MASRAFEELRVYQLAEQLADAVWEMVATWKMFAKDTVGKQIVRSADSVGANIAYLKSIGPLQPTKENPSNPPKTNDQ